MNSNPTKRLELMAVNKPNLALRIKLGNIFKLTTQDKKLDLKLPAVQNIASTEVSVSR